MEPTMPVLEIAEYALRPGTAEADLLAARPAVESWLARQPGFRSIRLARDGDRWADVCEWQDMGSAQAAAAIFMEDPEVAAFMALLDPATVAMRHLEVVTRS
jgi:hypothetical protein